MFHQLHHPKKSSLRSLKIQFPVSVPNTISHVSLTLSGKVQTNKEDSCVHATPKLAISSEIQVTRKSSAFSLHLVMGEKHMTVVSDHHSGPLDVKA